MLLLPWEREVSRSSSALAFLTRGTKQPLNTPATPRAATLKDELLLRVVELRLICEAGALYEEAWRR